MRLESTYTHTFTTSVTSDTQLARSSWPTSDSTPVSWSPRPRRVEGLTLTYYAPNPQHGGHIPDLIRFGFGSTCWKFKCYTPFLPSGANRCGGAASR